jgi:hypothetical protein
MGQAGYIPNRGIMQQGKQARITRSSQRKLKPQSTQRRQVMALRADRDDCLE